MEALGTIAAAMAKGGFAPHLLYGVTGSGKTAVYFAAMQRALDAGKSALLLVPEIGLTPAMTGQLVAAFGDEVALLHSQLTPDERAEQWHRIRRGEARVVVGTRSAVFAPMAKLGLIIVDEEHDGSYKQEETPRYHGRDVAVMRAKLNDAVVVLGSATPSLESWANAEKGRYARVEMRERVTDRPLPEVELIDMREEFRETGQEQIFSRRLIEETQATLDRGEQAIILLNRRGYSFVVMCRSCGEKIECENCAISMTYHKPVSGNDAIAQPGQRLECHYCGFRRSGAEDVSEVRERASLLSGRGVAAGRGAAAGDLSRRADRPDGPRYGARAQRHGAAAGAAACGRDQSAGGHADDRQGARHSWRDAGGRGGCGLCAGAAGLSRGGAGVSAADAGLRARGARRAAGAGCWCRRIIPTTMRSSSRPQHDYPGFVAKEMKYRRWMHYPPFAVLANVVVQSEKLEEATAWSAALGRWFQQTRLDKVRVLGPAAAPIARLKRIYRYHFVLKAERRQALGAASAGDAGVRGDAGASRVETLWSTWMRCI